LVHFSVSVDSIQLHSILMHAFQFPEWDTYITDVKGMLGEYNELSDGCSRFEDSVPGTLEMFRDLSAENNRRKKILTANGVKKWHDLPDEIIIPGDGDSGERIPRPPNILLVVEEAIALLGVIAGNKEVNEMKQEIKGTMGELIFTCRSQGIYLIILMQRADAEFTGGAFREQLNCRIQVGNSGASTSRMLFETDIPEAFFTTAGDVDNSATNIKGRSVVSFSGGSYEVFQGFFSPDSGTGFRNSLQRANKIRSQGNGAGGIRRRREEGFDMANDSFNESKMFGIVDKLIGFVGLALEPYERSGETEEGEAYTEVAYKLRRRIRVSEEVVDAGVKSLGQAPVLTDEAIRERRENIRRKITGSGFTALDPVGRVPATPAPIEGVLIPQPLINTAVFSDEVVTVDLPAVSDENNVNDVPVITSLLATDATEEPVFADKETVAVPDKVEEEVEDWF